jgi:hypothetical protein
MGLNVVVEWLALLLRVREVLGSNLTRRSGIVTKVFRDFPQPLQENAGIVPLIRPLPLPSTSFQINRSSFHST